MADDVIYKRPDESYRYDYDFTPKLQGDSAIHASNSVVTAIDDEGDAASAVVGTVSRSGMILTADLQAGTDGRDYLVTFKGIGNTTSLAREWVVEMRVRSKIVGVA